MTGAFIERERASPRSPFSVATAVDLASSAGAEHRYRGEVHDGWDIGGNANGGYVLAIAGRAMADAMGRPPLTVTAHYLAPVPPGPCEVVVTTVRDGRRLATCTAALVQGGRELIRVLGTFGAPADHPVHLVDGGPPVCRPTTSANRPTTSTIPSGRPSCANWPSGCGRETTGSALGRPVRAGRDRRLVRLCHGGADRPDRPVARGRRAGAGRVHHRRDVIGWVPTVELTVHVRAVPAPGPLRCVFRTRFIGGGMFEEDGEIWDGGDTLVAQSRQLALTPRSSLPSPGVS